MIPPFGGISQNRNGAVGKSPPNGGMKTYVLSFAASTSHVPEHPERTAIRSIGDDVTYKVWASEGALDTTLSMQQSRASSPRDWKKWTETNYAKRMSRRDPEVKMTKGKRVLDYGGDTVVAHYKDKKAELTNLGAKWWDYDLSQREVREPIQELATLLGHSILVTYKTNKEVSRIYPVNSEEAYRRGWYPGSRRDH